MANWKASGAGEKRFISRADGRRSGALVLGSDLSTEEFRQQLNGFIDHQRSLVKNLTAGNIRLVQIGALVPPALKARATALAGEIIGDALSPNDMLVPCGEDGYVILFHKASANVAEERTREIGDRLAAALIGKRELRGITARSFTYDLTRYLDSRWVGTVDDLKRVVRQAYEDHVRELRASVRRAEDRDGVRFAPVIAGGKRLLIGYDVRLYLEAAPDRVASAPHFGRGTAAERAELTALTVERLAFRLGAMTAPLANVLLILPVAADILANPLYWANFEAELFALPAPAQRRLLLNVDLTGVADPGAFLERHAARLSGKGRGMIATLPIRSTKMIDFVGIGLLGLSAASDKVIDADLLPRFVRRAADAGLRSFWLEHHIGFGEAEIIAAQPTYFALCEAIPEINEPQARYRRHDPDTLPPT
ncbi:MAG: hypothetical protein NXI16_02035 [Alphaproteobacteria bacterium]|nr:hypothetical protein [Alphaproteobacteria bacterium]